MPWTKEDRSYKTLINRRTTDSIGKQYYNEYGDFTINVHSDEIWMDNIDSVPATTVSAGIAELRTLFTLTWDNSVPNYQCYYAYESGNRLKDWISTKYGDGYLVRLYDNNNAEIFPTDTCQWFFDYQTGILTFNGSTVAFSKPFKISGYRYIGTKGGGSGTSGTSGIGVDGTSGTSGFSTSGSSGIDGTSGSSGFGTSGTSGVSGLQWYDIGSAGQEFNVCATGTGITLSRIGNAYTLNFPTGVRIITASVRIPLANMTGSTIILSTNLPSSGNYVNKMIITSKGIREDTGGSITPLVNDSNSTYNTWNLAGLSTTTFVYLIINFHQPLTA